MISSLMPSIELFCSKDNMIKQHAIMVSGIDRYIELYSKKQLELHPADNFNKTWLLTNGLFLFRVFQKMMKWN